MTTTIALPTIAELDADKYTLEDVESQLKFLTSMLKYGHKSNKASCLRKIDYFLDIRLELTK